LTDRRLIVRFSALAAAAAALFVTCWWLAFLLLPVGLLRGRTGAAALAGGDQAAVSFAVEFLRLFALNFSIAALVIVAPNLLRTRRGVPLGYWSALMIIGVAAVVTGTNSFSIRIGPAAKLAPSLELLGNPGPYELAAYILAATATCGIGRWQLVGRWPRSTAPRIDPKPRPLSLPQQWLGLGVATATLLATAAWEASRVLATVD